MRKGCRIASSFMVVFACLSGAGIHGSGNAGPGVRAKTLMTGLPLLFEENRGQTLKDARYLTRGSNFDVLLTPSGATWVPAAKAAGSREPGRQGLRPGLVKVTCLGMSTQAEIVAEEGVATRTSYLRGRDPFNWHIGIANHRKIRYRSIYPGVDWVFYGNQGRLEYDFVVSPGADPDQVRLVFEGADALRLGLEGELIIQTVAGELRQLAPRVYQQGDGKKQEISARYRIDPDGTVTFDLGDYDPGRSLVIDPVLVYSTYLGGSRGDLPMSIAVDSAGNSYILGSTGSTDFPLLNPAQDEFAGGGTPNGDVFVTKLDPSGAKVLYSTYLGGGGTDSGAGIAVDSEGQAFGTGTTFSGDFPSTPGSFQTTCSGQCPFVFKLSADGSELVFATFVGRGDGTDIAVDAQGQAVITGRTTSADFPVRNAFQTNRGGGSDAYVAKLAAGGDSLVFSTFLGGSGDENLIGKAEVVTDANGNLYVTGRTRSNDFPTMNPIQGTYGGEEDAFVTKLTSEGSLVYSTFLGGSGRDQGWGISADADGNAYVTGTTLSTDFPTQNALQASFGGGTAIGDAFVTKIAPGGQSLVFSTYLGGQAGDIGADIAVDSLGQAVVVGNGSSNFPVMHPLRAFDGIDNFVVKLSQDGTQLVYSTPIGGGDQDIAVATLGTNVYVAGNIAVGNLPVLNAIQPRSNGDIEAFLVLISDAGSLYFAQFGNGPGAVSDILLTNSSSVNPSTATVKFRGDDGSPVPMTLAVSDANGSSNQPAPAGELQVTVPPLALVRVTTDGQGDLISGSVTVDFDSPLGGVIRFNLTPFGTAGVGESKLVRGFITPVRRTAINTGVALFNPEDSQVGITMRLRDKAGQQVQGGLRSTALPAGGHLAQFIDELFPNATLVDFEGTLTVEVGSLNSLIAAAALELGSEPGQFTTLPVTPLP